MHFRGLAPPSHTHGTATHHLPAGQQHAVPLVLQRRPAALDRIVFAVIGRIVDQTNFETRPVCKLHDPAEKLARHARILRAIVQIDYQPANPPTLRSNTRPPPLHAVAPKITALVTAKNQCQQAAAQHQHAKRNQLGLGRRIVIERLGHVSLRISPRFSPPSSTRPILLSFWYRWRFLAFPSRFLPRHGPL